MQQLECRTSVDDPWVVGLATGTHETPVRKDRPQALAAAHHHALKLVKHHREVRVKGGPATSLSSEKRSESCVDSCGDLTQSGRGIAHATRLRQHTKTLPNPSARFRLVSACRSR